MNSGFVVGTGDLSELALGWCTYNADHMSMYNVNVSIPKTLVKFLVSGPPTTNSKTPLAKRCTTSSPPKYRRNFSRPMPPATIQSTEGNDRSI